MNADEQDLAVVRRVLRPMTARDIMLALPWFALFLVGLTGLAAVLWCMR